MVDVAAFGDERGLFFKSRNRQERKRIRWAGKAAKTYRVAIELQRNHIMTGQKDALRQVADALIAATNAFDVDGALRLFTPDAVIDDPSTGHRFDGHAGVRDYIERYFIGYHTVTRLLSIRRLGAGRARVRVDFTGDFGHEIGRLDISTDPRGLIVRIDAELE
jgi:ketosteroid isomerase-like protein